MKIEFKLTENQQEHFMETPPERPATIEDVAKLAGVSIATVSRALRTPEKVAESTRKKVTAAIARTGYTANAMAQNLRMQRSKMVLILTPSIADPNFAGILTGLEKTANDRGYGVLIGNTEGSTELEQNYLRFLSTGMADGLILLTGHIPVAGGPRANVQTLPPIVATERPVENDTISYIGIDDLAASKVATEYLISLGHRKITFISGGAADIRSDLRFEGYKQGLAEAADPPREWRMEGDGSSESGRAAVERLFIKDDLPTAFFCFNDNTAIGVISALQLRGYNVPKDFSVIGFDDIPFASHITPGLTTVRQPRHHIGEKAMELLLDQLSDGGKKPKQILKLHGDLIVRESCAAATSSRI